MRGWAAASIVMAAFGVASGAATAQVLPLELAVKASYLPKFAPYVTWPAGAFATATSPVYLCIVGHDPFGTLIDQAVAGQHVEDRPLAVRRLDRIDRSEVCHIAYLGGSDRQSVADALHALQGVPVLTVTDQSPSAGAQGMIDFRLHDGRVRFHIDEEAAGRSGLAISSRLLGLALTTRAKRRG